jgi:Protein kinase domain/FHA domain
MDQLGRFQIQRELGSGRRATVYEVLDGDEPCALRVIAPEYVPADADELTALAEALNTLADLKHPSVVKVLEADVVDDHLYLCTVLQKCPTLAELLTAKGSLDEAQAILYIRQVAQALDRAHDLDMVHGDLHPGKIFVVSEEKVKVADVGVLSFLVGSPAEDDASDDGDDDDGDEGWISADDLLQGLEDDVETSVETDDYVGMAGVMLAMLGADPQPRGDDESAEEFLNRLRSCAVSFFGEQDCPVSEHVIDFVRRLLKSNQFATPGEVVVELASAMVGERRFSTGNGLDASTRLSAGIADEAAPGVAGGSAADSAISMDGLEALVFAGDPRTAAYTPFFAWDSRRSGKFFVVYEGERLTLGRDPELSDVALMDPACSRKHCIISKENGVIHIEDLGSSNGTFVNEERISSSDVTLADKLRIGATRVFMSMATQ